MPIGRMPTSTVPAVRYVLRTLERDLLFPGIGIVFSHGRLLLQSNLFFLNGRASATLEERDYFAVDMVFLIVFSFIN